MRKPDEGSERPDGDGDPERTPDAIGDSDVFRAVVRSAPDPVLVADREGVVVFANPAAETAFGYDPDRLRGRPLDALLMDASRDRFREAFDALLAGARVDAPLAVRVRRRDGSPVPVSVSGEQVSDGAFVAFRFRESREGGDAKGRPREERDRFRSFVQEIEDYAIFTLDPEGRVTSWNDGAHDIKGYEREQVLGQHFSLFYTAEDVEAGVPERNLADAVASGRVEDEGWRVRKDGSLFWANVVLTALRDDDGNLRGFTKVTRDMTERREHQERLRRERDRIERIFETVPVGIAELSADGEVVRTNERGAELFGRPASETDGESGVVAWRAPDREVYDADGRPMTPADRPYARALETGEPVVEEEVRFVEPSGKTRWLSVSAAPLRGESADADRAVVAAEDVTRLKEQAEELARRRDALQRELDDVFSRVTDAFFALDADWRFTYLNERADELINPDDEELLGTVIWESFPDAVDTAFQEEYERAMEAQRTVTFEEYLPSLGVWFEVRAYPSETGLSVYFQDVSERKHRERTLAELHDASRELPHLTTEEEIYRFVVDAATDVLGLSGVCVYRYDADADVLEPAAHSDDMSELYGELPTVAATPESSITGHTFVERETATYEDVQRVDRLGNSKVTLHRGLFVPIGDYGVFIAGDHAVRKFDDRTVDLAELLVAHAESAVDRVTRERALRERERELTERNERLDAFASMVAHELRNPLEIAHIYTDIAASGDEAAFEEIGDALDRMAEMIDALLVVSRGDEAVREADVELVDLASVAEDAWANCETGAAALDVRSDRVVAAEEARVRQILENLFRNSVEHAGPEVTVRIGDLEDSATDPEREGGSRRGFYVEDDGPGIPESERAVAFQAGHSTSNVGIGFGLAVVAHLANAYGWECSVVEGREGGARFEFTGVDPA